MGPLGLQSRLMCHVVDELANRKPDQLFCVHPISSDISQGWRKITFKDLASAVNCTAWWIDECIDQGTKSEPLAYMGANDIRYAIFILACMKTGHVALLPSPRNSETAFVHVLSKTTCSKFVYSAERRTQVQGLGQRQKCIQTWEISGLWEMFDSKTVEYRCERRFADVENDPSVIIHSSGTTGLPKPVYLTNGFWSVMDNLPSIPVPSGRNGSVLMSPTREGKAFFTMAPFFHLMGLYLPTQSIFHNIPFVLAPEKPMTVDLLARILDETAPEMAILTPSFIEELASTPKGLDTLKRIEMLFFAGAPLSKDVGDILCQDITLQTGMGSSEAGFIANLLVSDKTDWQYLEWNPAYGVDMQHITDEIYELVLCRAETRDYHGIFHTYPDIQEYRTKDLFVQHPTKTGLWRYKGRLDDVIVLSNGEKFNPIEMEKVLEGNDLVSKALVVGQARFQPALLIEPNWQQWVESNARNSFIDLIWPTVQKANEIAPSHGQVLKTKIGLASRDKPFKTTPKGSIQRQLVVNDYVEEIDALYAISDEEYVGNLPQDATLQDIMKYVQCVVSDLLSVDQIQETSDIFALGLDSLQTLRLGKILQGLIRSLRPESDFQAITSQKLYAYPSIKQLSEYVYCLAHGENVDVDPSIDEESGRRAKIDALVEKYTRGLPETQVVEFNRSGGHIVILTGSTGSLGNYILSELLKDAEISKIYCLNRADDARKRQVQSFEEKGLTIHPDLHSRVEFLTARFGNKNFGLPVQTYERLKQSVDTIIHNAWKVNFNHNLEAFEDTHIEGVRRLVDFSIESAKKPHIHFISSVATVGAWRQIHGQSVPEIPLDDPDVSLRQGYGESKHVSERICATASACSGVPTSIYRIGQIGGPTTEKGVWNKQEWLPSIVATSKTLRQVPTSLGAMPVDWTPVDTLARIIVEIIRSRHDTETDLRCAAFHLVNSSDASWDSLIPAIQQYYTVDPIDLGSWLEALEVFTNPTESDFHDKPALKIMDFYRGLVRKQGPPSPPPETTRAQAASYTMRSLVPINTSLMENWLRQWGF